jgi:hypothetical protein
MSVCKITEALLVCSILLFSVSARSQFTFHGVVQDTRGEKLPGVNVIEKGTSNGTVTNGDGEFSITSAMKKPTIVFSFIGLVTQEISASPETPIVVTMLDDEIALIEPTYCWSELRYSNLGVSPGINYGRIGFKAMTFTPSIGRIGIRLNSNIEWRTDHAEARYLDIYLRRYQLFRTNTFSGAIYGGYKTFRVNRGTEVKELNIAPEFVFNRFRLSIGYTRQEIDSESNTQKGNGYYLGAYAIIARQLGVDLKARYVNDKMQYDLRVLEEISNTRFSIGAGYEKIDIFEEVSMTLLYQIDY